MYRLWGNIESFGLYLCRSKVCVQYHHSRHNKVYSFATWRGCKILPLSSLVKWRFNTLKEARSQNDIDNNHMLSIMEQKLCSDDWKVWSWDLENEGEKATLEWLMTWMDVEIKSCLRATSRSSKSVYAFQFDTPD